MSVLKAQGCQDGPWLELTVCFLSELIDGAVLRSANAVTAVVPGDDALGDVHHEIIPTLPFQRPLMLQDSEVEILGS